MMTLSLSRRAVLAGTGAFLSAPVFARLRTDQDFSWEWLQAHALDLARKPYVPPPPAHAGTAAVTYDALNSIAYRADRKSVV